MKIANPIYDVVFKYLLEDLEIAKYLLEVILKVQIESLEFKSQEVATVTQTGIRVFRLDFKAVINVKNEGHKTTLIEIQKAKKLRDFETLRFRRYLGKNYEAQETIIDENGNQIKVTLPILPIYFLGFRLKSVRVPVVFVGRDYYNAITNRRLNLKKKEPFLEKLSHDIYAIQIPRLRKMELKTQLEKALDVFSQVKYKTDDNRVLDYTGNTSDPNILRMVNRLNLAILDENIRAAMQAEEEVESELNALNKQIEAANKAKEEERKAKEEERKAKEEERKAKEEAYKEIEEERKMREEIEARYALLEKQMAELYEKINKLSLN